MIGTRRTRASCRLELEPLEDRSVPATLYGLTSNNIILRFDSASPGTIADARFVSGLQAGERIVGIDFRPRTGQLFGVGVISGATDIIRTYTINSLTGVASPIPGSIPFTVTSGNSYGVDFNPTTDRLRVVNDGDENFRINPNNGARADTPTSDTDINTAGRQIEGVAYDRNFDTGFAVASRTTLYGISVTNSSLVTIGGINQSPTPNAGAIMNSQALGIVLSAAGEVAFDIPAGSSTGLATLRNNATGLTGLYSINLGTGAATIVGTVGNGATPITGLTAAPGETLVTGTGTGAVARVKVFDGLTGLTRFTITPYGSFTGGVRVATADVNLDGIPDIVVGPGPGAPLPVKVFNGVDGTPLAGAIGSFFPFGTSFQGGINVAAGDVNGDGFKDVIVAPNAVGVVAVGGHVKVFSGATGSQLLDFTPFGASFAGGVRLAAADFDRDGRSEILTATGSGVQAHVRVFDGTGALFASASLPSFDNDFLPMGLTTNGVFVAAGDVNGDGVPDIVIGAGSGSPPRVKVFNGVNGSVLASFLVYGGSFTGGVRVGLADQNADGRYDIRIAPGSGRLASIQTFDALTLQLLDSFLPYGTVFSGGAFVAGVRTERRLTSDQSVGPRHAQRAACITRGPRVASRRRRVTGRMVCGSRPCLLRRMDSSRSGQGRGRASGHRDRREALL